MYIPNAFSIQDRRQIDAFIASNSFGMLVTNVEGRPVATHLPLLLDADNGPNGTLWGHIARANDQWRTGDVDALAVFSGPHAYISPTYYQVERTVPTWNYVAVHVYGRVSYFEDQASLREVLRRMVDMYERPAIAHEADCPECGRAGRCQGDRERELITCRGATTIREPRYFGPCCRKDVFPADHSARR